MMEMLYCVSWILPTQLLRYGCFVTLSVHLWAMVRTLCCSKPMLLSRAISKFNIDHHVNCEYRKYWIQLAFLFFVVCFLARKGRCMQVFFQARKELYKQLFYSYRKRKNINRFHFIGKGNGKTQTSSCFQVKESRDVSNLPHSHRHLGRDKGIERLKGGSGDTTLFNNVLVILCSY